MVKKIEGTPEHNAFRIIDLGPILAPVIGANINGKANFQVGCYLGRLNHAPQDYHAKIAMRFGRNRFTFKGVRENMSFSMNFPRPDLADEVEYIGSRSASKVPNKIQDAKLKVFYGKMGNVPMIEQCPVNFECSVMEILAVDESYCLVVGTIEHVHIDEDCIVNGKANYNKMMPLYRTHVFPKKLGNKDTRAYHAFKIFDDDSKLLEVVGQAVMDHPLLEMNSAPNPHTTIRGRDFSEK